MLRGVRAGVLWLLVVQVLGEDQVRDDDWVDPYDMIHYDSTAQTMRRSEPANYPNVPTKRREHTPASPSVQLAETQCATKLMELQKQLEGLTKTNKALSQQPVCTPVFKRFLRRLLKEVQRIGVPTDSAVGLYDAKIKLSKQAMSEIQTLLDDEEHWRTGALDNALSQILMDLKPHDYDAWRWHFEDTFGIDLDTVLKLGLAVLLIVAIISTQLWSKIAWCVQLRRLFVVCFVVSIFWNWFYMYKIAFADHQKNMVKMEGISEKCTGLKKYDWYDNLKELYRSTVSLQDDPCKKYYELIFVNPLLLVPPTKAISVTIVTFITEPLKHVGEGISDFIRALLKDLPVSWQIIVFPTLVLLILAFMYLIVHGAFRYGVRAPFRDPQPDPPPPARPQRYRQQIEDYDEAPRQVPAQRYLEAGSSRNQIQQRRGSGLQKKAARLAVETMRTAERRGETDDRLRQDEQGLSAESESEEPSQSPDEPTGPNEAGAEAEPQPQRKQARANKKPSNNEAGWLNKAPKPPAEKQPSQTDTQEPTAAGEANPSPGFLANVETVGVPVQETSPTSTE